MMAKVEFRPDVDIQIPDAAFEHAERLREEENKENRKLLGLIEKRIKELKKQDEYSFHYEINMLQILLKESKKWNILQEN